MQTLPTLDMNSSKSLARHLCESCIQNTVLASLSSGVRGASGLELRTFLMWYSEFTLPEFLMGDIGPRTLPLSRRGGDPSLASTLLSLDLSLDLVLREDPRRSLDLLRREDLRSSLPIIRSNEDNLD
jgi:hypothetical protein